MLLGHNLNASQPSENVSAAVEPAAGGEPEPKAGMTTRAIVIGLILTIGFTVAGCFSVFLRYEIIGTGYLPRGAVSLLLVLIAGNAALRLLKWLGPRLALTARELLIIFIMLLVVGAIAGQEYAQHVYLNLVGIVYYTSPDIAPPELYLEDMNPLLVPSTDRESPVIRWAFEGFALGHSLPWRPWAGVLLVWTPFFFALYWMVLCFAAVIAHRWEREEKLLYPLVQVPVEIVAGEPARSSSFFHSRLMWGSFGFVCLLYIIKGLHAYWPSIPDIVPDKYTQTRFAGPYAAFNSIAYHFRPDMIGIAYLLTAEVGFSLWLFYWFRRIEQLFRTVVGIDRGHYQFFEFQSAGSYAMLAMALLWSARRHLRRVWAVALGTLRRDPDAPDADEPYRIAILGFLGALIFIVAWCVSVGMSVTWAIVQYALFPLVGLVVARVICEAGMFVYSSPFKLNEAIFEIAGTERIGLRNVTLLTMTSWTQIRSTATMNMAAVVQGLKIGSDARLSRLSVMLAVMAAIVVAILTCHVTAPYIIYKWTVPKLGHWCNQSSLNTTNRLVTYLRVPTKMEVDHWVGIALGAAITWGLVVMRQKFVWWPLHPLGFIAFLGWPIERYWLSIFIGWFIKMTVVRLAGFRTYRGLRPGAFGLILGSAVMLTVWIIIHFIYPAPALLYD